VRRALLATLLAVATLRAGDVRADEAIQLGPRPSYLVEAMDPGPLRDRLLACEAGPFRRTDFSIGHRGAALEFPEHSDVSYRAAARMGAGLVECDVTFTRDGVLVCRHSECDLHLTTNIVATALNARCTVPWRGPRQSPPPQCCTSDLTAAEFSTLEAKMEGANPAATTAEGYLAGTPSWRTDLYAGHAHVMTFRESIELNERLGVKHIPELKAPVHPDRLDAIFGGRDRYAQALVDELVAAGVDPGRVFLQSEDLADLRRWIAHDPEFGRQALYLATRPRGADADEVARWLAGLRRDGVRILAPPMSALLSVNEAGELVPSTFARQIRSAGLDVITWTLERSDLRKGAADAGTFYAFDPRGRAVRNDGDQYLALDVLARQVGVRGVFSDWPATVSFYASCMNLE
jgi:glycerophosphoryl diester phosphodiesterase